MIGKNAQILTNVLGQGGLIGTITDIHEYKNSYGEVRTEYLIATSVDEKTVREHWYRAKEVKVIGAVTKEKALHIDSAFRRYGEGYIEMNRKRKKNIFKVVIALAIATAFWIGFGLGLNA